MVIATAGRHQGISVRRHVRVMFAGLLTMYLHSSIVYWELLSNRIAILTFARVVDPPR